MKTELSIIPTYREPPVYHRELIRHKRKKRDKSARWLIRVAAVSLALNMVQSVIIYILQVGPI